MSSIRPFLAAVAFLAFAAGPLAIRAQQPNASPAPSRTASPDVPSDVADLLKHVESAAGTKPKNYVSVTTDGEETWTTYAIGDDERTVFGSGRLATQEGTYHGQDWVQNENGQTVLEKNDPDIEAVTSHVKYTLTHVEAPVAAVVISQTDPNGFTRKTFIDPATYGIVRVESIRPRGHTLETFANFKTVAGYTQPYTWSRVEGDRTRNFTLTRFDANAATAADLQIPQSRRSLVTLPAGMPSVVLPTKFDQNRFIVRVIIAGRGLDFQLDSGAAGISIDEEVAKSLNLSLFDPEVNEFNGGAYKQHRTIVSDVAVGPIHMSDVAMNTIPSFDDDVGPYKIVGLLGFDFIADLVLRLDYEHQTLTAFDPDSFKFPAGENPAPIVLSFDDESEPRAEVSVNGSTAKFVIDTGADGSILVTSRFLARYPHVFDGEFKSDTLDVGGVGGSFHTRPVIMKHVSIANTINYEGFAGLRVDDPGVFSDSNGLIGTGFLHYFTVYLDYGGSYAYFVRNGIK